MKGKAFVDTNILLYLIDKNETDKRKKTEILFNKSSNISFVWSTQVIKEFSNILIKKFKIDGIAIKSLINEFNAFELIAIDKQIIFEAIDIQVLYKFSFYDSLILSAANFANCKYLISEDLQHNQTVKGVEIINPFNI